MFLGGKYDHNESKISTCTCRLSVNKSHPDITIVICNIGYILQKLNNNQYYLEVSKKREELLFGIFDIHPFLFKEYADNEYYY